MKEDSVIQETTPGLVSVIVPVYNSGKTLNSCLESLINQSYKNLEIILIDDGSTDNSREIAEVYAEKDKRFSVVSTKNNGPAAARNIGLGKANGEYIFFLDADDNIEKEAISLLIKYKTDTKADIIIGGFKKTKAGIIEARRDIVFSNDKLLSKPELAAYARAYLTKPNKYLLFAFAWGRLFETSIIRNNNISFNAALHTFEDVSFNFEYLKHTNKVFVSSKSIYNHTISEGFFSATMSIGSNPLKLFGFQEALKTISKYLENEISGLERKAEIGHAYVFLTIIQLVRICGQINADNKKKVRQTVEAVIQEKELAENLKYYTPASGDSKVIPFLMKLRLVWLIILVCKYKSKKRYVRGKA